MTYSQKRYTSPGDYWRARGFFRRLQAETPRPGANWHVADFDYWRWHCLENVVERPPDELRYWEADDGKVVAVLAQGDPGVCHPMVDPAVSSEALRHEMLSICEAQFVTTLRDGRRATFVWSGAKDAILSHVLEARGYEPADGAHSRETHGWQPLPEAPAPTGIPSGYSVRSMGDVDELPARSLASWRSFHPGEPDDGADPDGAWYRNVQRAPLYRRDLDVVAVTANGDIASFVTCFFDDVSRTGDFVLVGSAPPHQRKGLAKAVMTEALRRLHRLGALGAYVSWYEPEPGALYESVGFTDQEASRVWRKHH